MRHCEVRFMLRFEGHRSTELSGQGKLACPEAGRQGVLDA